MHHFISSTQEYGTTIVFVFYRWGNTDLKRISHLLEVTWLLNGGFIIDLCNFCQTQSVYLCCVWSFFFKLSFLITCIKTGSSRMVFDFQAHVGWEFYFSLLTQPLYLVIWQLLSFGFLELQVWNDVLYWFGDIAQAFLKAFVLSSDPSLKAFHFSPCSQGITLLQNILSTLSLNMGFDMHGSFCPCFPIAVDLSETQTCYLSWNITGLRPGNHFHLFLRYRDKIILMERIVYMFCAYICSLTSFLKN